MMDIIENLARLSKLGLTSEATQVAPYLIGDLSRCVGLEPATIRFYEAKGLIAPRRIGHMRAYDASDVERLMLIKSFRKLGLTLAKTKIILAALAEKAPEPSAEKTAGPEREAQVAKILSDRLKELVRSQAELEHSIALLEQLLGAKDKRQAA